MSTCETCQFWSCPITETNEAWGACEMAESEQGQPNHKETMAYAAGGEFTATLYTNQDFGCNQYRTHRAVLASKKG